ncbi:type I restriction-modification enzyme R subunit C-terminal domain-containing protein [Sorangium sp. So ce216]
MTRPEDAARKNIDDALTTAGWAVQDRRTMNLDAARGVAVREFPLKRGHGFADYLLYVDGEAVGVIEAKEVGTTLTGVEGQTEKYSAGLPDLLPAPVRPLPFLYQSTGVETAFTNRLDPDPRSRCVFHFHKPETLVRWITSEPVYLPRVDGRPDPLSQRPASFRTRLLTFPDVPEAGLRAAQVRAVRNLEVSLRDNRPRALIQMATGAGKTVAAITSIYRLIKFGDASRVLFLVDRDNLGRQALKEFQQYVAPDDGRKFTELYNVQRLTSNKLDPVARVVITTIQRLYSMLKGDADLPPEAEELGLASLSEMLKEPVPVAYNPSLPIEAFDAIFVDECHRSIYSLWRQALEYFDGFLVGLTATPAKQTFAFFRQNLIMDYDHERAVADGVNVDFDVYKIRTRITEEGATVEAGPEEIVGRRDRETRKVRWELLDDDLTYDAAALDRQVVALDQIRTVVRTFRDRLFTEIFPGRREVPKTLIFAKDDSHADDIVQAVREEFGKGNEFCEKITYKTGTARIVERQLGPDGKEAEVITYKSNGVKSEDLLSSFRNSYNPRVVVTVDMIATGTDVKPLEIVMFMRAVRSRNFFEQMKGRGVRVINPADLQAVTPDARAKDRFVLVDCVGVCETDLIDALPLEKNRTVGFEKLLEAVAQGSTKVDVLSSLAGRLARLDRRIGAPERAMLAKLAGGRTLAELSAKLVEAIDPDAQAERARAVAGLPADAAPPASVLEKVTREMLRDAVQPLRTNPELRRALTDVKKSLEQTIDAVTKDEVTAAGFSDEAKERAKALTSTFEAFCEKHRDQITALQILYSRPHRQRLKPEDVKALADAIKAPPRQWTPEVLWRAYETLERDKVRGAGAGRLLTDVVSLVRFALHQEEELVPFRERVQERFELWMTQQANQGRKFSAEQRSWLEAIRDHMAANLEIAVEDFEYAPFAGMGGVGKAARVFGAELANVMEELNEVLAA